MTRRTIERHVRLLLDLHDYYHVEDRRALEGKSNKRNEIVERMNREREWLAQLAREE